jgi:hypothetical protein
MLLLRISRKSWHQLYIRCILLLHGRSLARSFTRPLSSVGDDGGGRRRSLAEECVRSAFLSLFPFPSVSLAVITTPPLGDCPNLGTEEKAAHAARMVKCVDIIFPTMPSR